MTWLTSVQLERMHVTEGLGGSYQLRRVCGVRSDGEEVEGALSDVTVAGAAVLGGGPLGLASIPTPGSSWPRGTQREAWDSLSADMGCASVARLSWRRCWVQPSGGRGSRHTSIPIAWMSNMDRCPLRDGPDRP